MARGTLGPAHETRWHCRNDIACYVLASCAGGKLAEAMKELIVFDLDGTLAESKSPLDSEMAQLLNSLLGVVRVAIISGGAWQQFEHQLLAQLCHGESLRHLSLLPTCGTQFYVRESIWTLLYSEDFQEAEKAQIIDALKRATRASESAATKVWGEIIEDRGSQITFSALGQLAPLEDKKQWDPDFAKRIKIKANLDALLPNFSVHMGGATSIDVTKKGIDKAYGIRKLRDVLGISIGEMLFIGDALFPGGNDYPAREAGVQCIEVRDPLETKRVIQALISMATPPLKL
jgi:HAD superfamily hydrolase (TIGR01484 family)